MCDDEAKKGPPPDWLYDNIAEASKNARKIYFIYVAFLAYCTLTILSTTDKQIILNAKVKLPILGMDSSLYGFFILAPIILILIFIYLMLYIYKKDKLIDELRSKYDPIEESRIYPWILNFVDSGHGLIGFFQNVIVSVALWYSLPIVLFLFSIFLLKAHDTDVSTIVGISAMVGTLLVSYFFWPAYKRSFKGHEQKKLLEMIFTTKIFGIIFLFLAVYVILFELFITIGGNFRHYFSKNIDLSYQVLIDKPENDYPGIYWGNFEGVNLGNARLINTVFERANLQYAYFNDANLQNANFKGANLRHAYLRDADLSGTDLTKADLQGADIEGADLRDANLEGVNLYWYKKTFSKSSDDAQFKKSVAVKQFEVEKNIVIIRFSKVKTLYGAKIDPDLESRLKEKYPHLFIEPKENK